MVSVAFGFSRVEADLGLSTCQPRGRRETQALAREPLVVDGDRL